jgi:hypothetical protein
MAAADDDDDGFISGSIKAATTTGGLGLSNGSSMTAAVEVLFTAAGRAAWGSLSEDTACLTPAEDDKDDPDLSSLV